MYEISWFATLSLALAGFIETLKHSGAHGVRDLNPRTKKIYPFAIKLAAFALGLVVCFVAEADALLTLEVEGFAPEVGYVVGAIFIVGGETLIDAAWDNRKMFASIMKTFLKGRGYDLLVE